MWPFVKKTSLDPTPPAQRRLAAEVSGLKDQLSKTAHALSVHQSAGRTRFTGDWRRPHTSADSAILPDARTIVASVRQAVRDNPVVKSGQRAYVRSAIGTGITPKFKSAEMQRRFDRWAKNKRLVDRERRRNFYQIQRWAARELYGPGMCLIVMGYQDRGPSECGLVLQGVEMEQLDYYKLEEPSTGNQVRHGVEVDDFGAPVAYHIFTHHPHDYRGVSRPNPVTAESTRIDASRVLHLADPERVRETISLGRLQSVVIKSHHLGERDAAELLAARQESNQGIIIKGAPEGESEGDSLDQFTTSPLMVARIQDGEEVVGYTPTRPGNGYEPFARHQEMMIAAGSGLSYESLMRDYHQGNFSSQRQAVLEEDREIEPDVVHVFVPDLCDPIAREVAHCAMLEGVIPASEYLAAPEAYSDADWRGQGRQWVDPVKQVDSIERKIKIGLATKTREANKLGESLEDLQAERIAELGGEIKIARLEAELAALKSTLPGAPDDAA